MAKTDWRQRLVDNIVSAEMRLVRAQETQARNIELRGGVDAIDPAELASSNFSLSRMEAIVQRRYKDLAAYDAKHGIES